MIILNDEVFLQYAMRNYDNPQCCTLGEFEEDLNRFLYLKKLFNRYENGELKERLILNHLIILYNVFGGSATNMLFYKLDSKFWSALCTFLVFLERLPEELPNGMNSSEIKLDEKIIKTLREL